MSFDDNVGCPPGWTRDEWMREVPKNETTGEPIFGVLPCDLPLAGFWALGAALITSRLLLGLANIVVLRAVREARGAKTRRKRRGLAPAFDILNTVFVILFICLAPVTSSRNGVTWVLYGLAFTPYFIGSYLFLTKIIRNRLRIAGNRGGTTNNMPRTTVHIREERLTFFLLIVCFFAIIGAPVTWIIGAAAFGGSVTAHRVAIALFCVFTSTSQIVAFSESVRTANKLNVHMHSSPRAFGPKLSPMRAVRFRLLRSALTFFPVWIASTALLISLAVGALPFHWYITYILMSMPVINAAVATAMFMRPKNKSSDGPSSHQLNANFKSGDKLVVDECAPCPVVGVDPGIATITSGGPPPSSALESKLVSANVE